MLLISWVVVSYLCGRQAELLLLLVPQGAVSQPLAQMSPLGCSILQYLQHPSTCYSNVPACWLVYCLMSPWFFQSIFDVVNLLVLSVISSWCMDDIQWEKTVWWKLYIHFPDGVPQWLFYIDGCERFGESWHGAPDLPPALRFLLAPMSGIHLGTVKFNIPGFFYMKHALEKLSGSKLKAKNAALQRNGLAQSVPSVINCICTIPRPPFRARGDSL